MSQADDFHAFSKKQDWRMTVEAAKPGAATPVMYTPGPVDVKTYEADHAEPPKKEVPDAPK